MKKNIGIEIDKIVSLAKDEAIRLGNSQIHTEHLFMALIQQDSYDVCEILISLDVDVDFLIAEVEYRLKKDWTIIDKNKIELTTYVLNILTKVAAENSKLPDQPTSFVAECILLAILSVKSDQVSKLLALFGVDYSRFRNKVLEYMEDKKSIESNIFDEINSDDNDSDEVENMSKQTRKNPKDEQNVSELESCCFDVTEAAKKGLLDPIVGREVEIDRMIQILSRRRKNNPILVGEPGVGKSAIVEGMAMRIIEKKVPRTLADKRILSLDMSNIVAGTKYRGEFEAKMQNIIKELSENRDIIIFFDEIHTIVGAGSTPGSLDAANILKPYLSRGELQCIGATTLDEYRKYIEKDGALERRFQKVLVDATTSGETFMILKNLKDRYEDYHKIIYSDKALEACVRLSDRYITDRTFPDKAIDLMDEAGSMASIKNIVVPEIIEKLETEIKEVEKLKVEAVKEQKYEKAAAYRDDERKLIRTLKEETDIWNAAVRENRGVVDDTLIAEVVSMMTGIPVNSGEDEATLYLGNMGDELSHRIIGQADAIDKVVKAICRNKVGIKNPNRPIGSFIFLGPTGVGKTELAKEIAKYLFKVEDAIVRIDMSEYMEKYSLSRLIGAPPGYVGYDEGGQLTERVRRKPYSVVLLDEIEKAHPDIFNILLQILDEGRITDSNGRYVDFKNTIIIMTSNIGSREIKDFGVGIGFSGGDRTGDKKFTEGVVNKALKKTFSPEFLNRLDDVIFFNSLKKEDVYKIVEIELSHLLIRTDEMGLSVDISNEAKEFLVDKGYDPQYGARPIKRAIQKYVEDIITSFIISSDNKYKGKSILIDYTESEETLNVLEVNSIRLLESAENQ